MKKYILGIAIGSFLLYVGSAIASVKDTGVHTGIEFVNKSNNGGVYKYYDYDNNVVCYTYPSGGISCLKNI